MSEDGAVWVASMGHLLGLFDHPWLGVRPTGKIAMLRYGTFHKVENGKITEEAMYFDLPHLMVQAGQNPFPPQTAQHLVQPGPMTHDGVLYTDAPEDEGRATLAAIDAMISDLGSWDLGVPLEEELRRTWHEDMVWWGPEGIGATYTIPRYAQQHSGPFRAAFTNRSKTGHICRTAEGHYGGFFGWPNFTAKHVGGFMGMPATQDRVEFRVIDFYRREADKLAENWIFIDLLHLWDQQGVDILKRHTDIG
jgi:Predicted ester cyclase